MVKVYMRCDKCGHTRAFDGYNEFAAYHIAMGKYGWAPFALDTWLCESCSISSEKALQGEENA